MRHDPGFSIIDRVTAREREADLKVINPHFTSEGKTAGTPSSHFREISSDYRPGFFGKMQALLVVIGILPHVDDGEAKVIERIRDTKN